MGRDHSEICSTCGEEKGGMNDLFCSCNRSMRFEMPSETCAFCAGRCCADRSILAGNIRAFQEDLARYRLFAKEQRERIEELERERDAYRAAACDLLAVTNDISSPSQSLIFYRAQTRDLLKSGPRQKRCSCTYEAGDTHPCEAHPYCNECEQETVRPVSSCSEHTATSSEPK